MDLYSYTATYCDYNIQLFKQVSGLQKGPADHFCRTYLTTPQRALIHPIRENQHPPTVDNVDGWVVLYRDHGRQQTQHLGCSRMDVGRTMMTHGSANVAIV